MRVEQIEEIRSFELDVINRRIKVNGEIIEGNLQAITVLCDKRGFNGDLTIKIGAKDSLLKDAKYRAFEQKIFDFLK